MKIFTKIEIHPSYHFCKFPSKMEGFQFSRKRAYPCGQYPFPLRWLFKMTGLIFCCLIEAFNSMVFRKAYFLIIFIECEGREQITTADRFVVSKQKSIWSFSHSYKLESQKWTLVQNYDFKMTKVWSFNSCVLFFYHNRCVLFRLLKDKSTFLSEPLIHSKKW